MMLAMVLVVVIRFGVQNKFNVTFEGSCTNEQDGCEEIVCDDVHSEIFGCVVDDTLLVQVNELPYHDFASRVEQQ